jgi:hypothetical protein
MALGPRGAAGLCSASRAKRHSGSGPSAQTLGRTASHQRSSTHMSRLTPLLIGFMASLCLAQAHSQTITCTHLQGERLFSGNSKVLLERKGVAVTIRTTVAAGPAAHDFWNYRVIFEEGTEAFRALRSSKPEGGTDGLDVVFGGELFLRSEKGVRRLLVTSVDVSTGKVASEQFTC